jgi:hypothetical protein
MAKDQLQPAIDDLTPSPATMDAKAEANGEKLPSQEKPEPKERAPRRNNRGVLPELRAGPKD